MGSKEVSSLAGHSADDTEAAVWCKLCIVLTTSKHHEWWIMTWMVRGRKQLCKVLGFCTTAVEVSVLLGCDAFWQRDGCITFRDSIMVSSAMVKLSSEKRILRGMFKPLKIWLLHLGTIMLQSQWYSATFQKNRDFKADVVRFEFYASTCQEWLRYVTENLSQDGWLTDWDSNLMPPECH
jgi:hypothetical protein